METLKDFLNARKTIAKNFSKTELLEAKKILVQSKFKTKPILIIKINKEKIDVEDFKNSIKFLKGLIKVEKKNEESSLKLFFKDFDYTLRCVLFFSIIIDKNDLKNNLTINYEKEDLKLNLKSRNKNQTILRENNFKLNKNQIYIEKKKFIPLRIKSNRLNNLNLNSNSLQINSLKKNKKQESKKENKKKFTGRFYLHIDNSQGFEVSKKIIGKKGKNMKQILYKCKEKAGLKNIPKDFLKLRLRGKGSLYKEGTRKQECNDKLHLCVSAKSKEILLNATIHIEKLLLKLKKEYVTFCKFNNIQQVARFFSKHIEV